MPNTFEFDTIIERGTIVDGSGATAFESDVGIVGDVLLRLATCRLDQDIRELTQLD